MALPPENVDQSIRGRESWTVLRVRWRTLTPTLHTFSNFAHFQPRSTWREGYLPSPKFATDPDTQCVQTRDGCRPLRLLSVVVINTSNFSSPCYRRSILACRGTLDAAVYQHPQLSDTALSLGQCSYTDARFRKPASLLFTSVPPPPSRRRRQSVSAVVIFDWGETCDISEVLEVLVAVVQSIQL